MSDPSPSSNAAPRTVADYRSPSFGVASRAEQMPSIAIAIWCGAISLVVGIGVFLLWLVTRAGLLQLLGMLWIFAGLVLFAGGGLVWLIHLISTLRSPAGGARRKQLLLSCVAIVLLLVNFPACALIIGVVERIETSFTVQVRNAGTVSIASAAITYGGTTLPLGVIAPGAIIEQSMVAESGPLQVSVVRANGSTDTVELRAHLDEDDVRGSKRTMIATVDDTTIKAQ